MNLNENKARDRKRFEELVNRAVDHDLTTDEHRELEILLSRYPEWKEEWEEMKDYRELITHVPLPDLPDTFWDRYWRTTLARLERGIAWALILFGGAILLAWGLYHLLLELLKDTSIPLIVRLGILTLLVGFLALFLSVIHEKWVVRRYDRYSREVRR